MVIEHMVTCNL